MTGRKLIACAVDGGRSEDAVKLAARLARELSAELVLVHVRKEPPREEVFAPSPAVIAKHREEVEKWTKLASSLRGEDVRMQLASGSVAEGLVDFAQKSACDLLVLSSRAKGPIRYAAAASVGQVLAHAPCPVLVVPGGREDLGTDFPGQAA